MKKYGLNLRIPPGQQKQQQRPTSKPPPPPAFAFKDDDDDEDDVERDISRQAAKTRALQKVEEQHKKALEEDPSVFDYDGVYDEMKEKIARPRVQDKSERKSKYIETLMQKAKEREREHEIIYEKKILKERSKEDHLFADKEKFVTSAYKKQLAERAKWMEEERLRQIREEQEDVTKKKDLSEFYFGLDKNIAFGAQSTNSAKPSKQEGIVDTTQEAGTSSKAEPTSYPTQEGNNVHVRDDAHHRPEGREVGNTTSASQVASEVTPPQENTSEEAAPPPAQTAEAYKRSEDAVAAARERFLARKRAKEQADKTAAAEQYVRSDDAVAAVREIYLARKKAKGQL